MHHVSDLCSDLTALLFISHDLMNNILIDYQNLNTYTHSFHMHVVRVAAYIHWFKQQIIMNNNKTILRPKILYKSNAWIDSNRTGTCRTYQSILQISGLLTYSNTHLKIAFNFRNTQLHQLQYWSSQHQMEFASSLWLCCVNGIEVENCQ